VYFVNYHSEASILTPRKSQMKIRVNELDQGRGLYFGLALAWLLVLLTAVPVNAQQITGTPGLPSATTTINGRQIPNLPAPFGGVINLDARDSKPYWQPQVVPPEGAPNILLILTDDVGFGAPSTFGGVIPTPALDRIASTGLRYTQFHTTSLCSPMLGLFDRPADEQAFAALLKSPAIPGLTESLTDLCPTEW
jgi:hypothetical protein